MRMVPANLPAQAGLLAALLFCVLSLGAALAEDGPPAGVYWLEPGTIRRAQLDGERVVDLITTGVVWPERIALDARGSKMYWTDENAGTVSRANLNGASPEILIADQDQPRGIALDIAGGKVYWTEYGTSRVRRANLDGTDIEDLITTGLFRLTSIALDLYAGKMYFPNRVDNPRIQRSNLDGTNVEAVVTTGLYNPNALTLDLVHGKIYWSDSLLNAIRRANLDGSQVQTVVMGSWGVELAVDPRAGQLYWTHYDSGRLLRLNFNSTDIEVLIAGLNGPRGLALDLHPGPGRVPRAVDATRLGRSPRP